MGDALVVKISKNIKYKLDLEEELKIEETNLNSNLSHQPSLYLKYARIAAQCKAKAERQEYRLEEYENDLDLKMREKVEQAGKKITENKIKALIRTDSMRMALVNRMIRAKEQYEIVQAAKEAFNHRKDCLISIGANRRAEHETDLVIKDRKNRK